jgi:hypothetical protein
MRIKAMPKTTLPDQKTIKLAASNERIASDKSVIPRNVVVMPMTVLAQPEKISKPRRKR